MVIVDQEVRVAQYGQWDHYPEGQGTTALDFLRRTSIDTFRDAVRVKCRWVTPEQHKAFWAECGADPDSDFVSMEIASKFAQKHPQLDRDCGAEVLEYIMAANEETVLLADQRDFIDDSLFCEWAYLVDLDRGMFEVYKGFQTTPLPPGQRFADRDANTQPADWAAKHDGGTYYYPCAMLVAFKINNLPSPKNFVMICNSLVDGDGETDLAHEQLTTLLSKLGGQVGVSLTKDGIGVVQAPASVD